jgi:hypothetical protein
VVCTVVILLENKEGVTLTGEWTPPPNAIRGAEAHVQANLHAQESNSCALHYVTLTAPHSIVTLYAIMKRGLRAIIMYGEHKSGGRL